MLTGGAAAGSRSGDPPEKLGHGYEDGCVE